MEMMLFMTGAFTFGAHQSFWFNYGLHRKVERSDYLGHILALLITAVLTVPVAMQPEKQFPIEMLKIALAINISVVFYTCVIAVVTALAKVQVKVSVVFEYVIASHIFKYYISFIALTLCVLVTFEAVETLQWTRY